MSSVFENFFKNNLLQICYENKFKNLNCILGSFEILISIILIVFIILGLIKMLKFYESINLETILLIFSILQILLLDIIIIIPHDFLFECFFFIQIIHISLTIRKFIILAKNPKSKYLENFFFIIINLINIILLILYILSFLEIFLGHIYFYIKSFIRILYFITAIILTILCRIIIKKLKILEKKNIKYELNLKHQESSSSNKSSNLVVSFENNEWMFISIRERQITPLYILNLICSFIQMSFVFSKHFLLGNYFVKNEKKIEINEDKNLGFFIYYSYFIICFINVLVNYICFYYIVKEQYKPQDNYNIINSRKKKKVLDDRFISRESIKIEEDEKEISVIMEEKIKDKKKYLKSIYSNTFTEDTERDKQDKYFVHNNDKDDENKEDKEGKDIDEKKVELVNHQDISYGEPSERITNVSNNPINQSTEDKMSFLN